MELLATGKVTVRLLHLGLHIMFLKIVFLFRIRVAKMSDAFIDPVEFETDEWQSKTFIKNREEWQHPRVSKSGKDYRSSSLVFSTSFF